MTGKLTRTICLCLIAAALVLPAKAAPSAEEARQWARDNGLPEDFVSAARDELILQIYDDNKELEQVEFATAFSNQLTRDTGGARGIPRQKADDGLGLWVIAAKSISGGYVDVINVYISFEWAEEADIYFSTHGATALWNSDMWLLEGSFRCRVYGRDGEGPYVDTEKFNSAELGGIGVVFDAEKKYGVSCGDIFFRLIPRQPTSDGETHIAPIIVSYGQRLIPGLRPKLSAAGAVLGILILTVITIRALRRRGGSKKLCLALAAGALCLSVFVMCRPAEPDRPQKAFISSSQSGRLQLSRPCDVVNVQINVAHGEIE